jgi:tRNA A-37 threonylcarbamoyl transferase component Bud32
MSCLEIVPRFRELLRRHGLCVPADFLAKSGVILSGHPTRHVLRVRVGGESFILKKEHRVRWRDRLANTWEGFGWSSKSIREAFILTQLRGVGLAAPEVAAYGEEGARAFLLVRDEAEMADLRVALAQPLADETRRNLAAALGRELARLHAAGFEQPDLFAKHVLAGLELTGWQFCFLDWQRSRRNGRLTWQQRTRDLAALDASLAASLAGDRLRLACLRAYLREAIARLQTEAPRERGNVPPLLGATLVPPLRRVAPAIRAAATKLLTRRKIRELCQPPLPAGAQQLLWLHEDERLCVARDFFDEMRGQLPACLWLSPLPRSEADHLEKQAVSLTRKRSGWFVRRWSRVPSGGPRSEKFPAPEFAAASMLFRLERFGVRGPRVLALGHFLVAPTQRFSFLLTEPIAASPLEHYLRSRGPAELRACLEKAGRVLRQIHEAGYRVRVPEGLLHFWAVADATGSVVLADIEHLEPSNQSWLELARVDLPRVFAAAANLVPRREMLRFLRGYLKNERREKRRLLAEFADREGQVA